LGHPWDYYSGYQADECPSRTFLDATPSYLSTVIGEDGDEDGGAARRLVQLFPSNWLPEVRLLAVLREPIARTLSHFNMALRKEKEDGKGAALSRDFCNDQRTRRKAANDRAMFDEDVRCDQERVRACFVKLYVKLDVLDGEPNSTSLDARGQTAQETPYQKWFHNEGDEQPASHSMLARGVYAPQLRLWHAPQVVLRRDQLCVVDMQRLIDEPTDTFNRITNFYGLGDSRIEELPDSEKRADGSDKHAGGLDKVSCETRKELQDFFGDWNERLVQDLQTAQTSGMAPPAEPWFSGFAETQVECE